MTEPRAHREIERKLEVPARFRLPDLGGTAGVGEAVARPALHLVAVYYDTADLRLARHRITLRRRTGGGDDGWHLKLPHTDEAIRDELQLPLDALGDPPQELTDLVLGITRGAPLAPVATLRNERRPTALFDTEGRPLAEATDDRVSVVTEGKVTARFRELEVEAADGRTAEELDRVVATLVAAGAKPSGFASKAARALGPQAAQPADVVQPGFVARADPAVDAMTALIALHVAALIAEDLRLRRDLPDAVHQMRVAARKLRSNLKVFAPLFDEAWCKWLGNELKWLADELAASRDREVLEARLLAGLQELSERDAPRAARVIQRELGQDASDALAQITSAMTSPRYLHLLDELVAAAQKPRCSDAADAPCADALPPLMRAAWKRLEREVRELRRNGPDQAWHEARIRAKHARYAAEALVPVFGKPAARLANGLAEVTDLLGRHQDAAIAAETARRLANAPDVGGRAGYVLGLLQRAQRDEVAAIRRGFLRIWPQVARPSRRKWLRPRH